MQFPQGMQMPSNMENMGSTQAFNIEQLLSLGSSVVVLLIGLFVVVKWKR